jgi:hypothetical protein
VGRAGTVLASTLLYTVLYGTCTRGMCARSGTEGHDERLTASAFGQRRNKRDLKRGIDGREGRTLWTRDTTRICHTCHDLSC